MNTNQIQTNTRSLSSGCKYVCPTSAYWCCYVTLIIIIHKYNDNDKTSIHKYKYRHTQIQIHSNTSMHKLDASMSAPLPLLCCYAMQIVINTNINQTYTNTETNIHKYLSSGCKYVCPTSADWCWYETLIIIIHKYKDKANIHKYKYRHTQIRVCVNWMQVCLPHFR